MNIAILYFLGAVLISTPLLADPLTSRPAYGERASILGSDLKIIRAALPVFEKHGLKIDGYRILILDGDDNDSICVLFDDPERKPGQLGSTPNMASFEVVPRRSDLSVSRSNFSR
jgi:hypothetical protein